MTSPPDVHHITVESDGRLTAAADVRETEDPATVCSALHVESGQLPPGTRARLVDAVLDDPRIRRASRLIATMPTGDTDMLERIRERAVAVEARAVGATKLVEVQLYAIAPDPLPER